jgi:hypothetical protein
LLKMLQSLLSENHRTKLPCLKIFSSLQIAFFGITVF